MKKYMRICNLDEIPINGMRTFDAEDGSKILVANYGECHYAYSNICPHQGTCLSEGFYDGAVLTCRKHLWQWDITTGKPVGIADSPLENYLVKIEDSEIFVRQASTLRQAQLFTDISSSTQAKLEHLTRYEEYDRGSVLYEIGDPTDDIYILDSGRIEFQIGRDDRTSAAGFILRKGEVFGWAALLEYQPLRIAKAVCEEKSAVLRLNGKEVLEVLEADPDSGFIVMRQLSTLITKHLTSSGEK